MVWGLIAVILVHTGTDSLGKKKRLDLLSSSIYVELLFKVLYNFSRIKPLQMHPDGSEPP